MTDDPVARLEHDHIHLNRLVDDLRESTQAALRGECEALDLRGNLEEFIRVATDELFEHFDREETVLFPFLVENFPDIETTVSRLEAGHDRMCGLLSRMERMADADDDTFVADFDALIALFARFDANYVQHSREERALLRDLGLRLDVAQRKRVSALLREL